MIIPSVMLMSFSWPTLVLKGLVNIYGVSPGSSYTYYIGSWGGAKPLPDPINKAFTKATADKQLGEFKRQIRNIVDRTLPKDGDALLFKPRQCADNVLSGVGILGRPPTIACNVVVTKDEEKHIAINLSKLIRTASHKKHTDFVEGAVKLIPHELKLNGRALGITILGLYRNL